MRCKTQEHSQIPPPPDIRGSHLYRGLSTTLQISVDKTATTSVTKERVFPISSRVRPLTAHLFQQKTKPPRSIISTFTRGPS